MNHNKRKNRKQLTLFKGLQYHFTLSRVQLVTTPSFLLAGMSSRSYLVAFPEVIIQNTDKQNSAEPTGCWNKYPEYSQVEK